MLGCRGRVPNSYLGWERRRIVLQRCSRTLPRV